MLLFTLAALIPSAQAQEITINIDRDMAEQANMDPESLEQDLSGQIDGDLNITEQVMYAEEMARAAVTSVKGMGVDYASNPQRFVVGYSLGSAVSGAGAQFGRGETVIPEGGYAFQMAAMAGLNLGFAAKKDSFAHRFNLYASGLTMKTSKEPFAGDLYNLAGHFQIKLLKPRGAELVQWGGIDFTTGYETMGYTMSLSAKLPIETDSLSWSADGNYTIGSKVQSVPLELSTNLKLAVITVFAGGALDHNLEGHAVSEISLSGPLQTKGTGVPMTIGTASVTAGDVGDAAAEMGRVFGGVQANIFAFKVYGHVNAGFDGSFGGHIGARVAI